MSNIVIIGAGKTGRGFLGRLLREKDTGCTLTFIDKNAELVEQLNREGSFTVSFFGNERPALTVGSYRALTWQDPATAAAIADCDLILVSVCGQNLNDVGKELATYMKTAPKPIITAENASHPAKTLNAAMELNIPIAEGTVFCTTMDGEGLGISSENYPYFQFDTDALPGFESPAEGIRPIHSFSDFLTRKLYTYNAASCVIAYLGYMKGYTDYGAAANDPEILAKLDRNYEITNRVLCKEFGYEEQDQKEFALLSRRKFMNRTIADTIDRNARDPQRKLADAERIMGPLQLQRKYGEDSSVLEETVAAALNYDSPSAAAWLKLRDEKGIDGILTDICGLPADDPCRARIAALAAQMKR